MCLQWSTGTWVITATKGQNGGHRRKRTHTRLVFWSVYVKRTIILVGSFRSTTVVRVTILGGVVKDKLKGRAITTGQTVLTKEGITDMIKTNTEIDPTATINGGAIAINILSKIYLYL